MKKSLKAWYTILINKIREFLCKCDAKDLSHIELAYVKNIDYVFFTLDKELAINKDEDVIYRKISDAILKIFGCDEVDIYIWNQEKNGFILKSFFLRDKESVNMPYNFIPLSFFPDAEKLIRKSDRILIGDDLLKNGRFPENIFDFSSFLVGGFYEKDNFKGIVLLIWKKNRVAFEERELKIFNTILNYLSSAITQSVLYNEVMSLAVIDTLTGLYNRRFLDEALIREYERAKRYKRNLSLVMFDINNFKYINDNFGHLIGDLVLREISRIIKENIRSIDIPVRYGGDEIVLLLPETSLIEAEVVVKKIREKLKEWNKEAPIDGFNGEITISAGWADINETNSFEEMIQLADERMYKDKRAYKEKKAQAKEDNPFSLE